MRYCRGVIPIESEKRIDWNKIRAEYIGGASIREIAKKHGISKTSIGKRCAAEKWTASRTEAADRSRTMVIQKIAETAVDNATLAANIKRMGLEIIAGLFEDFASVKATEHRETKGRATDIKRLRDLTAAYKDLTGDIVQADTDNALLQSLMALERGRDD